jgi:hypothetical protein
MRRLVPVALVALLAFVNASIWAVITPAFQGPDEDSHVAYAIHLAETGHRPTRDDSKARFSSSESILALDAVDHWSVIQFPNAAPPWLRAQKLEYERKVAQQHPLRDDGGGRTGAAQYGPVYYALPAAGYLVAGGSFFDRLLAMRVMSALLAGVVAAFAYGIIRELIPRERWPAVAGGLLVGFQPMFGFISGTVNADGGVNAAGAALIYLLVRSMRRGLTPASAIGIPAVFALGVMAKTAMLAFAPAIFVGLLVVAARRRASRLAWAVLGLALTVILAGGLAVGRNLLPLSGTSANVAPGESGGGVGRTVGGTISYMWQVFLPPLPGMQDVYTGPGFVPAWQLYKRAWGSFGWQSVDLPAPVFYAIGLITLAALVLATRAALRERVAVRARAGELLVLVVAFFSVVLSVNFVFARYTPGPTLLEQGRYFFPVITVGAVVAVGACFGLGRRLAPVAATALVASTMLFSAFAQLFVLTSYYG